MGMPTENSARLAVLIDADNARASITEELLAEVTKYGTAHVERAYGDWTGPSLRGWKDQLLAQSIQPIQQFGLHQGQERHRRGHGDRRDGPVLYSGRFDGFYIVSSDSDFTRLAQRLRGPGSPCTGSASRRRRSPSWRRMTSSSISRTWPTPWPPPPPALDLGMPAVSRLPN